MKKWKVTLFISNWPSQQLILSWIAQKVINVKSKIKDKKALLSAKLSKKPWAYKLLKNSKKQTTEENQKSIPKCNQKERFLGIQRARRGRSHVFCPSEDAQKVFYTGIQGKHPFRRAFLPDTVPLLWVLTWAEVLALRLWYIIERTWPEELPPAPNSVHNQEIVPVPQKFYFSVIYFLKSFWWLSALSQQWPHTMLCAVHISLGLAGPPSCWLTAFVFHLQLFACRVQHRINPNQCSWYSLTLESLSNPLFSPQCYKIFGSREEKTLTWHSARSVCRDVGGNLASIHNNQVQGMTPEPYSTVIEATYFTI